MDAARSKIARWEYAHAEKRRSSAHTYALFPRTRIPTGRFSSQLRPLFGITGVREARIFISFSPPALLARSSPAISLSSFLVARSLLPYDCIALLSLRTQELFTFSKTRFSRGTGET